MTTNAVVTDHEAEMPSLSDLTEVVRDDFSKEAAYTFAWDSYIYEVVQT